jgi:hypothetical protein
VHDSEEDLVRRGLGEQEMEAGVRVNPGFASPDLGLLVAQGAHIFLICSPVARRAARAARSGSITWRTSNS